ncbi:nuclear speckle splicing regulatory protein 1 [Bacillus rossius redtenbacheri]|uniref:nuclear speckle splicing regulatory protein 1 n=1 Tax=Bacillus rossius redtenbacheri TaxID=93214 RepID=UPI002FDE1090
MLRGGSACEAGIAMSGGKAYGLVVPKKGALQPRHSVFGDDSSDEAGARDGAERRAPVRKAKLDPELDGELLSYDDYHDTLERERAERAQARREGAQARYIPLLLQQAERRRKEAERRTERLVQKEREAEGEQFRDKETFVTASYRRKVEEFATMDADERRRDRLEELGDVTKQRDLGAFYGALYKQTVGVGDAAPSEPEPGDQDPAAAADSLAKKSRHYRKRKSSSSDEHGNDDLGEGKAVPARAVRERDVSEGRRRSNEHGRSSSGRKKPRDADEQKVEEGVGNSLDVNRAYGGGKPNAREKNVESGSEEGEIREEGEKRIADGAEGVAKVEAPGTESTELAEDVVAKPVEKVNIWEKHTVGEVLEAAVQRYWQRKAAREAGRAAAK